MPRLEYPCAYCGKVRLRWASQVRNLSFCDHKCKSDHMRIHTKGENNSNYKHGNHCTDHYCNCGNQKDYRAKQCIDCRRNLLSKIDQYFCVGGKPRNATLWRYIKSLDLIQHERCVICGLGWEWNGKPISLHLDHINGNREDNRLENLRVICPNCHTQTDTYASKNRRFKNDQ